MSATSGHAAGRGQPSSSSVPPLARATIAGRWPALNTPSESLAPASRPVSLATAASRCALRYSGPHQITIGCREARQMPTAVRKLCGQSVIDPR